MNIIVEGMDATGKSTLAQFLAASLDYHYMPGKGPPKDANEIHERVAFYNLLDRTVFDRHPCVSNPIYDIGRDDPCRIDIALIDAFYSDKPIFIYCDPINENLDNHILGEHDTPEHMAMVQQRYSTLLNAYRDWSAKHAQFIYRIGDDPNIVLNYLKGRLGYNTSFDPMADLRAFHEKFRIDYNGPPRELDAEMAEFRLKFMVEELVEYAGGFEPDAQRRVEEEYQYNHQPARTTEERAAKLDALVDLVYVAVGTAYLHGFRQFYEAWRRVHAANMQKVRVLKVDESTRGSLYDVRKPDGWTPPVLDDLV